MVHWILDFGEESPASWRHAMPDAVVLREAWKGLFHADEPGIVWLRLAAGKDLASTIAGLNLSPAQRLVVLADEPHEALIAEALAAGATGCCNTHAAPEVLRQVALVVTNGGLWVGQSLLQRLVKNTAHVLGQSPKSTPNDKLFAELSEREAQVARLVAGGASNKEVSESLAITERTVKAHLTAIFEKLGLRDRLQLSVRYNGYEA